MVTTNKRIPQGLKISPLTSHQKEQARLARAYARASTYQAKFLIRERLLILEETADDRLFQELEAQIFILRDIR